MGLNRTDGGVYRGIGNASGPIVITPAFNEDATYWGDWGYSGSDAYRLDAWRLIDADGSTTLLDRGRRLFIHGGGCEATPPTAELTGPTTADTGEAITLDASGTTDDGTIGGYEWDFDADGEIDEVTAGPTTDHAFEERGNRTVAVTAFDTYGNGDTADLQVNVTVPATPPNASLDAPASATVNESVTLDASNATDEGRSSATSGTPTATAHSTGPPPTRFSSTRTTTPAPSSRR
ncbi:PKD domain protein [Halolamina pelagica]|uniref:PKD domain protein n=1 Tax=Halolamina pelagica TaxID=699431 RepID=A0A0N8HZD1_9EURY|nr:PKD domain-containing protein [Halolamina pelagica]KPN29171.1 PKD domain protein [Halolamina pelagica]